MTVEPKVGVVIVNYNGRRFLKDCVRLLLGGTTRNLEIVLVDNASTDGSVEQLTTEFSQIVVLKQVHNVGVAAGNNIGIEYCRRQQYEYVLLLNYDTLPEPNLIQNLLATAGPQRLVSGLTLFWDDPTRSNSHAGGFDWMLGRLREAFFGKLILQNEEPQDVEVADTCCLLVPRAAFDAIGIMDDAYFMYYDDTDFVVRARQAGFQCVLNPGARLRHYERGASGSIITSPVSVYYSTRNRLYFMKKHTHSRLQHLVFLIYFFATRVATALRWVTSGNVQMALWMYNGLADYRAGRMGPGRTARTSVGA